MELREFKKWLIDNKLENDELYEESIKCYQVSAYNAAYIFSYLANHKYIAKLAIDYNGIPENFMSGCPESDVRTSRWQERVTLLKDEDRWEQTVNDELIKPSEEENIFKLPSKIKKKYSHMRVLRNNSAHAKDRRVSESTVLELWNDIEYIYPYFVINGTIDAWWDELDKIVKYSNDDLKYIDDLFSRFNNFSSDNKIAIIRRIVDEYLIIEWDESYSKIVTAFLSKVFQTKKNSEELGNKLSPEEEMYIYICADKYNIQNELIDLFSTFEEHVKEYQFRYFCEEFADNFWKFIAKISEEVNQDGLVLQIMSLLKRNPSILSKCNFNNSKFLLSSDLFFEKVLEKISHLYYYTTNYSGQKRLTTSTFDYTKFYRYLPYVKYIYYMISIDSDLIQEEKVKDFIDRCKKLMTDDYNGERWYSEKQMQEIIKDLNAEYEIIQE